MKQILILVQSLFPALLLLVCLVTTSNVQAENSTPGAPAVKPIFDFSKPGAGKPWTSINDNVMGGISKGNFTITPEGVLRFSGVLSLENRGGFASIRTKPANLGLAGYDTIALRVRGDGRRYEFNVRTSSRFSAATYRTSIQTQKGVWQEIRVPLKEFEYAAFGKRVASVGPPVAEKILSVGFTLADKKAGPFQLNVAWIRAEKDDGKKPLADIVDTAMAAGKFKTLVAAAQAAGLVDALKGKGPLTLFAPTDAAFAKLPAGTVETLLKPENRDKLKAILTYHVVAGKRLLGEQRPNSLQGQALVISAGGARTVNGAKILAADVQASNGVIHVIDRVLLPPEKKEVSPTQAARDIIDLAIRRGVPLFNEGQPKSCASIYELAAESLLKSSPSALKSSDRAILKAALKKAGGEDDTEKSWTLRGALDAIRKSLGTR